MAKGRMGALTRYLQGAFAAQCPAGWTCRAEVPLVDRAASRRLGFEPRADVLLEHPASAKRVWVEFEISRADPVANHAKFATARFLEADGRLDTFVSMASRHIAPGRLALSAGTAILMRSAGIAAFQVELLPQFDGTAIQKLNASLSEDLAAVAGLDPRREIERALFIAEASPLENGHRIHKADNAFSVAVNVRQWNIEVNNLATAQLWGRRAVRYVVGDPVTGLFAPSKFCAFIPARPITDAASPAVRGVLGRSPGMTMAIYAALGEGDPRFDGHVARMHLERVLRYRPVRLEHVDTQLRAAFARWHDGVGQCVLLRPDPVLLLPPT